jgi:hypothetical protein
MKIIDSLKLKLESKILLLDQTDETDNSIRQKRLETCMSCDYLLKMSNSCKKCGCFVHAKTLLKNSKCPLNKW